MPRGVPKSGKRNTKPHSGQFQKADPRLNKHGQRNKAAVETQAQLRALYVAVLREAINTPMPDPSDMSNLEFIARQHIRGAKSGVKDERDQREFAQMQQNHSSSRRRRFGLAALAATPIAVRPPTRSRRGAFLALARILRVKAKLFSMNLSVTSDAKRDAITHVSSHVWEERKRFDMMGLNFRPRIAAMLARSVVADINRSSPPNQFAANARAVISKRNPAFPRGRARPRVKAFAPRSIASRGAGGLGSVVSDKNLLAYRTGFFLWRPASVKAFIRASDNVLAIGAVKELLAAKSANGLNFFRQGCVSARAGAKARFLPQREKVSLALLARFEVFAAFTHTYILPLNSHVYKCVRGKALRGFAAEQRCNYA